MRRAANDVHTKAQRSGFDRSAIKSTNSSFLLFSSSNMSGDGDKKDEVVGLGLDESSGPLKLTSKDKKEFSVSGRCCL
jgi:hypothetical protein